MEAGASQALGLGEVFLPLFSMGTLLAGLVIFGALSSYRRNRQAYWGVFVLVCLSLLSVAMDTGVLVAGGLRGHVPRALQYSRLHELANTGFMVTIPLVLWSILPAGTGLQRFSRRLWWAGLVIFLAFAGIAFLQPELFVSARESAASGGKTAYSSAVGRGAEGVLFPVRDAILGVFLLVSLAVGGIGIARRHVTGANTLVVLGILAGVVAGGSALYANFTGSYPGPLDGAHFSRVGLGIVIFTVLATAAYVTNYVHQSRALDDANRQLQHHRDRLAFLAYHNDRSDMLNKQALLRDLGSLFETVSGEDSTEHAPKDRPVAELFLCDLDSFASIGDSYGYAVSEALLRTVGQRVASVVQLIAGDAATVYHIEGDRFAVLVPRSVPDADRQILEQSLIREISMPLSIDDEEILLSAAVGQYRVTGDARDAEEVLRRLKRALADARNHGSRVARYSQAAHGHFAENQQLVQELRRALRRNDFQIYYQPIVDGAGRVRGAEALLRWDQSQPDRFIPLAEESGLIVPITDFVIRRVARELPYLQESNPELVVHINLSARHMTQVDLLETLRSSMAGKGLPLNRIGIEITETSFMHRSAALEELLHRLKTAGVQVSIDDFGTGYSSLQYLKRLPAESLKIDKSFIAGLPESGEDRAVVESIIVLARELGKTIVAEGVETAAQRDWLTERGVDYLQGHFFARPVPARQFSSLARLDWVPAFSGEHGR